MSLKEVAKRRLWSESGGYCVRPSCARYLFTDDGVDFGEMAHMIPASPGGPRNVPISAMPFEARADHENVVLLCSSCHTVVDKAPYHYPTDLMLEWKRQAQERQTRAHGTPVFESRAEARDHIEPLLAQNRALHTKYGPIGDPYADGNPALWKRDARSTIVPNNKLILRVIEVNRHLLSEDEKYTLAAFSLHVDHFEARQILDDWTAGSERFPAEMEHILRDDASGREST